jgi:site-specific DNA recombinase
MTAELALAADDAAEWEDIGYTRISDDRTGVAASPARQRRAITAEAAAEGRAIVHWFEDLSKSAYQPGVVRLAFEALLAACAEQPVRRLWVLHDDRLVRDGDDTDLPRLIRAVAPAKIIIRCVEAEDLKLWQASGKMTARMRNIVNVWESERKKERVELATADRARKGRFPGGQRRFGYVQRDTRIVRRQDDAGVITEITRPSGPLVLVPAEARAIADGYRDIAAGATLYAVAADWRSRGLTGPTGARLTDVAVREILLRPANAGLSTYKGKIVGTGDWPAITDPDAFATVKAILTDPSRKRGPGKPQTTLLAGVLVCHCGQRMNGGFRGHRDDGTPRLNYRCRACYTSRARGPLDSAVAEAVVARIEANASALTRPRKTASRTVANAIGEAAGLRAKIDGYHARATEYDDPADLLAILRGLRAKLAKAEAKIIKDAGRPVSAAVARSGDILAAWDALDIAGRRAAIREQVEHITVGPARVGSRSKDDALHNVKVKWRED